MTSRERVRTALEHREPDRVPIDVGGSLTSGIMVTTYVKLRERLGINGGPPRVIDVLQMLAEVEQPVMEAVGADVTPLLPPTVFFGIKNENWKPWTTFDGTEVLVPGQFNYRVDEDGDLLISPGGDTSRAPSGRMPKDGYYFDLIPRQEPFDWDELDPDDFAEQFQLYDQDTLEHLRRRSEELYKGTDYAVLGNFNGASLGDMVVVLAHELESPKGIRNYSDFLMAHVERPDYLKGIYARQTEVAIENLKLYREAVGDRIDVISISGTDFGSQRGELISPDLFRDIYLPFYSRINAWVHENTGWKTFLHCCGSIYHLIPSFIEAGVDVLNPVQTSAANMDPDRLKREFGERIVFWGGGIETQSTLPFGTSEQVRAEVAERMRIFGAKGGYVFNTIHNIQAKTPVANLVAMFEAAKEYGQYPIAG